MPEPDGGEKEAGRPGWPFAEIGRLVGAFTGVAEAGLAQLAQVDRRLVALRTLAGSGVVRPLPPDRLLRALLALHDWDRTPAGGIAVNAARFGGEPYVVDEIGHLSFDQVHQRTNALAVALASSGVSEGDSVGIMCRNSRYFVDATVAASKLGADVILLNTDFAAPQLADVVRRERPKALIFDQEFEELLRQAGRRRKRFVGWSEGTAKDPTIEEAIEGAGEAAPRPPRRLGRQIILTSGTTGTPKGAQRPPLNSLEPVLAILSRVPLKARERHFIVAPMFHAWGFFHFGLSFLLATTIVLRRRFDPESTLSTIAQHRPESAPMVPVMVQRIMQLPDAIRRRYDCSSLRAVPLSGSALPGDLAVRFMDEFGDVVYNAYGSTEVGGATIATPADLRAAPGTAGRPPPGVVVRILDEEGRVVPTGELGRIFVGSELLFEGYTGGGGKEVVEGFMSTGDVGHLDQEGRLFVSGRSDDMIVSGGENVFPREVEDLIANHGSVAEVAVIGVPDEEFGQRLKAFVVRRPGATLDEEGVKGHVRANLARYKVPREVEFLDELPRNPTGKVLKRVLAAWERGETEPTQSED